jgi:hypothetical protein
MRKRRYLVFTISVAILLGVRTLSASAKDFPCSDLRKAKTDRLISIFARSTALPNEMAFSHGLGCYSEGGEYSSPCDWKVAVSEDRIISEDRRLIVVLTDNVTGHGAWWSDVLVLGCQAGKVTALFNDPIMRGLDVEEPSADKLVLDFSRWGGSGGREVYVWSKDAQTYVLEGYYSDPIAKP